MMGHAHAADHRHPRHGRHASDRARTRRHPSVPRGDAQLQLVRRRVVARAVATEPGIAIARLGWALDELGIGVDAHELRATLGELGLATAVDAHGTEVVRPRLRSVPTDVVLTAVPASPGSSAEPDSVDAPGEVVGLATPKVVIGSLLVVLLLLVVAVLLFRPGSGSGALPPLPRVRHDPFGLGDT